MKTLHNYLTKMFECIVGGLFLCPIQIFRISSKESSGQVLEVVDQRTKVRAHYLKQLKGFTVLEQKTYILFTHTILLM